MSLHDIDLEIRNAEELAQSDPAAALLRLRTLADRHPESGDCWYTLGGVLDQEGMEAEAIPCYEKALVLSPEAPWTPNAYLQLASSYRNVGRLDDAKTLLEEGLKQFPDLRAQAVFLAFVEYDQQDCRAAVRRLVDLILSVAPEAVAPYARAIAYYRDAL